jgi:hypothetical protein
MSFVMRGSSLALVADLLGALAAIVFISRPAEGLALLQAPIRAAMEPFGETILVRIETMATFLRRDDSGTR